MKTLHAATPFLLAALSLATLSCGGGGGGSPGTGTNPGASTVQLLVGDAPIDDLSVFELTFTSARLVATDGTESAELLVAPRSLDLLDLQTRSALLRVGSVGPVAYAALRATFDPASVEARDMMGAKVNVHVQSAQVTGAFPAPTTLGAGQRTALHIDIRLDDSLTGSAQTGFVFDPVATASVRSSGEPIDEIHGRITATSAASSQLTVDLRDRETGGSLGAVTVQLTPQTALFDDNGALFPNQAAFFASALVGGRVEANGALSSTGTFDATVVKVEQDDDGVATVKGRIMSVDPVNSVLRMQIGEIVKGRSVVAPVLASLGNPTEIDVGFQAAIIEIRRPGPRQASAADLAVGQHVEVKFSAFQVAPFPARRIEIEDERIDYEGTVVDTSAMPASFVVRLEPHDPAVRSGRVASAGTNVTVQLDGNEPIYLKLNHEPTVGVTAVATGVRVRIRGTLSGSAASPTLEAGDVRIRPGRLRGKIVGVNTTSGLVSVDWDRIDDPFGPGTLPDPVVVAFASGARWRGEATSTAGLFALWNTLQAGQSMEVRIHGVGDGTGGLDAHEVKADVK